MGWNHRRFEKSNGMVWSGWLTFSSFSSQNPLWQCGHSQAASLPICDVLSSIDLYATFIFSMCFLLWPCFCNTDFFADISMSQNLHCTRLSSSSNICSQLSNFGCDFHTWRTRCVYCLVAMIRLVRPGDEFASFGGSTVSTSSIASGEWSTTFILSECRRLWACLTTNDFSATTLSLHDLQWSSFSLPSMHSSHDSHSGISRQSASSSGASLRTNQSSIHNIDIYLNSNAYSMTADSSSSGSLCVSTTLSPLSS